MSPEEVIQIQKELINAQARMIAHQTNEIELLKYKLKKKVTIDLTHDEQETLGDYLDRMDGGAIGRSIARHR